MDRIKLDPRQMVIGGIAALIVCLIAICGAVAIAGGLQLINPPPSIVMVTVAAVAPPPTDTQTPRSPALTPTATPLPLTATPSAFSGRIVFVSYRDFDDEIYIMNADGSNQKRLTNSQYSDVEPRFSPDGKTIAFSSNRTARYQVYLMRDDGGNPRRLTNDVAEEYTPTWSPNSKQVAITSNRGGNFEIWIYNVDDSNPRQITRSGGQFATWSPDGQWIAYSASDGSIRVIRPDGTGERILYSRINGRPSGWLGKRLLVNYAQGDTTDIYAINIDTKDEERLTVNALKNQMGGGTPDGRFVVFNSTRNGDDEIYVMNADGSNLRRLTNSPRNDYMPSWGP